MATHIERKAVLDMAIALQAVSGIEQLNAAQSWEPQRFLAPVQLQASRASQELFALYSQMTSLALAA